MRVRPVVEASAMKAVQDLREIVRYRELILALAMRILQVRYKYSLLGLGWALALPVSLMLVFTFVFSKVASVETGGIPYPIFVYLGLVPWQFHANLINGASRSLVDNHPLVTKVYFAREALPLSHLLACLFDFVVASTVLAGLMVYYGVVPGIGLALVPLVLLVQIVFGVGMALLVSAGNLLYRDIQYMLQVGITLWMFASSVVYPIPDTPTYRWLIYINPMTPIIDAYRDLIVGGKVGFAPAFWVAAAISFVLLGVTWRWFRHVERRFGELA